MTPQQSAVPSADRPAPDVDVAIVGAGISGIGMAAHLQMLSPDRSFALLERRAQIGGTWDLFRYPGVRSDSDMHTLGFAFEPWTHEKSIADGPAILEYLNRIADERDIRRHIRFDTKVMSAEWDSATARWTVTTERDGGRDTLTARWLFLGSGYYDYDQPYDAEIPGVSDFAGRVVHPQFWPEDLDYRGKRVVVIGSGATAVTIVPAMADNGAAHVTMLQRTPTWYVTRPAKDRIANGFRKWLPEKVAYAITRFKNVRLQDFFFKRARKAPAKIGALLTKRLKAELGDKYNAPDFTPPYNPWEQRLCLVPDGDLFRAIRQGKAEVVTARIDRVVADGVRLDDGRVLPADVIVTATGLKLAVAGKIAVSVDGERVDWAQRFYYKGCLFSNVPNLAVVFGYLNASWTLRADINAEFVCRVLNHMRATGTEIAVPVLPADHRLAEDNVFDFSSGYIQRSLHELPKNAPILPWRLNQDYLRDREDLRRGAIEDGVLRFARAGERALPLGEPLLEAAE